jgi:hypothetical protein
MEDRELRRRREAMGVAHVEGRPLLVGDRVEKVRGYRFPGVVVSTFDTLRGERRVVVECTAQGAEGCLHIYNEGQLRHAG